MEYTKLGNTGMDVSRICLGCMGFGDAERWIHQWVLNEENSRPIIKKALELGINFFDTANVYSIGTSEEILGRALKDFANRDEIVIATKVHGKMHDGPNGAGLSRKAILSEIDNSLKRLGTDYVDLYQIHRWDYQTPIEETMEALHDVVRAGKTRYIGASAMFAWQFQMALHTAEMHGWTRFVSMQDHLNLIYRLLLFREKTTSHPMLPLALFQERTFSATNAVAVCQTFTFMGFLFVMSLFLQQVKHYSPSLTGLALLPAFGSALVTTSLSGVLMPRIGAKRLMVIGLFLSSLGCFGLVLVDNQTSYLLLACLLAILGGGLAFVLPAMTEAAISHAPRTQSGIASGMLNVSRQVGGVIGVAILGALVGNQQTFLPGMHLAFVIAGGILALALVAAWVFMSEHDMRHPKVDTVGKPSRTTRPAKGALGRREKSE